MPLRGTLIKVWYFQEVELRFLLVIKIGKWIVCKIDTWKSFADLIHEVSLKLYLLLITFSPNFDCFLSTP